MTDHMNDVHALSGAYAVDALDEAERLRFEEHLRRCPDCRDEVDSLREAAASLAVDPVGPSPELRDRLLEQIETVRPLPPLTLGEGATITPLATRRRARFPRSTLLLAAAAAVLVALAGTLWLRPWSGGGNDTEPLTATERVLTADDATHFSQQFDDGSEATVVLSRSEGRAVVLTEGMAAAPAGEVYELWLQTPQGTMRPAGLMPDDPDATVLLDGDAASATGVGITVEPDGGSPQPTSAPIAVIKFST